MPTITLGLPLGYDESFIKRMHEFYWSLHRGAATYMPAVDELWALSQQSTTRQSLDTLCADAFKKTAWRYYLTRKDEYNTYPSATGHMFPWYHQNRKY